MRHATLLTAALMLFAGCVSPGEAPRDGDAADAPRVVERTAEKERRLMRYAMNAHREFHHRDAVEILEHALHARELATSGRSDEEALDVRRRSPKADVVRKQLHRAAKIYADAGKHEIAGGLNGLAEDLWEDPLAGTAEPRRRADAAGEGVAESDPQIQVFLIAAKAWSEKGRPKLVDMLENAIRARRMDLAGRRDHEANVVRESAPGAGNLAELLHGAARIWEEMGWETNAGRCHEWGQEFGAKWRRENAEREGGESGRRREASRDELAEKLHVFMERVERLEVRVRKLTQRLEELEEAR